MFTQPQSKHKWRHGNAGLLMTSRRSSCVTDGDVISNASHAFVAAL
jgi:hypothetical protein